MTDHDHGHGDLPPGGLPVMSTYDSDEHRFTVVMCLNGAHVTVELPLDDPSALIEMMKFLPDVARATMHVIVETAMEHVKHSGQGDDLDVEIDRIMAMDEAEFDRMLRALLDNKNK